MAARIAKEKNMLEKQGYKLITKSDTLWQVFLIGPEKTPFEGGQFQLEIKMDSFPFKSPTILFKTNIYHPNVMDTGQICQDILGTGKEWAPTVGLVKIMDKIKSMMVAPNLEAPINEKAASDYKNGTWEKKARETTKKYAKS